MTPPVPRIAALGLIAAFVAAVLIVVGSAPLWAGGQRKERVVGYGQIKFNGHGPEAWANIAMRRSRRIRELRHALRVTTRSTPPWGNSPLERAFLCIHSFEGSWRDPNAPHWGGVQMDLDFQRTYGPEYYRAFGTADHWPVSVQLAVAIKAYLSGRGFYPWPNTARNCGLL